MDRHAHLQEVLKFGRKAAENFRGLRRDKKNNQYITQISLDKTLKLQLGNTDNLSNGDE
jgi:hypothetical protein